jgi:5-formyltetrahydrofolate cyclo-ligase
LSRASADSPVALRRRLRAARRALTAAEQRAHAEAAARRLAREPRVLKAKRLAFYCAADGELDPRPLLQRLPSRRGRLCYLPVLRRHAAGRLWFVRWQRGERLRPNRFGIPEPSRRGRRIRGAQSLDLVLMPLVGFDADCNRIGMGAGYYDRSLAFLRHRMHWRRPLLIGLAHECQRVERIAPRPWDIPLDAVVSEAGIYWRGLGARG